MASASSSALAASMTATSFKRALDLRGESRSFARCCQRSVAAAGRNASETSARARQFVPAAARRRARCRSAAAAPAGRIADGRSPAERSRGHRSRGRRRSAPRIPASRSVSRPGSTTAPCVELADGGDQGRGRRHRAGGAGDDHRAVGLGGEPLGFGLDQRVAARGRLDGAVLGQQVRAIARARS